MWDKKGGECREDGGGTEESCSIMRGEDLED